MGSNGNGTGHSKAFCSKSRSSLIRVAISLYYKAKKGEVHVVCDSTLALRTHLNQELIMHYVWVINIVHNSTS
jgi:hypothetical protein